MPSYFRRHPRAKKPPNISKGKVHCWRWRQASTGTISFEELSRIQLKGSRKSLNAE
jgi:hypothetical protein